MIICVVGPTGVGKTKLSIYLAKKFGGIIVNCDAMQVYKDMNIGTAKIKEEEKENIPHYLFDIKDVLQNYTIYDYQKDARKIIADNPNKPIIFVGGSGLYLKSVLYDYQFKEDIDDIDYEQYSNEKLYELCLKKDASMQIHPNNRRRLIRFLKRSEEQKTNKFLYDALIIGLKMDKDILYKRIDKRVLDMIDEGLVTEVEKLYDKRKNSKALNTAIGYKELFAYFEKKDTLENCIKKIQQNSRHYAKRQYTFFRHQLPVTWLEVYDNFDKTLEEASILVKKHFNL